MPNEQHQNHQRARSIHRYVPITNGVLIECRGEGYLRPSQTLAQITDVISSANHRRIPPVFIFSLNERKLCLVLFILRNSQKLNRFQQINHQCPTRYKSKTLWQYFLRWRTYHAPTDTDRPKPKK